MEERELELLEIARRLRMARASCDLIQAQAADAAKISQSALSLYEKARREPHSINVKRLALVYGVSMDWLVGLSEEMSPQETEDWVASG